MECKLTFVNFIKKNKVIKVSLFLNCQIIAIINQEMLEIFHDYAFGRGPFVTVQQGAKSTGCQHITFGYHIIIL